MVRCPHRSATAAIPRLLYSLTGVVVHSGAMGGGHYISYIKLGATGAWYHASDSSVSPASLESVLQAQAYILFYKREE